MTSVGRMVFEQGQMRPLGRACPPCSHSLGFWASLSGFDLFWSLCGPFGFCRPLSLGVVLWSSCSVHFDPCGLLNQFRPCALSHIPKTKTVNVSQSKLTEQEAVEVDEANGRELARWIQAEAIRKVWRVSMRWQMNS